MSTDKMETWILAFDAQNRLAVRRGGAGVTLPFCAADESGAVAQLEGAFREHTRPRELFAAGPRRVLAAQVTGQAADGIVFEPIDRLVGAPLAGARAGVASGAPPSELQSVLADLEPHLASIPYLHLGENDFIYRFKPEKERAKSIYGQDDVSSALYQSKLCEAIKAIARQHERAAADPVPLDFGAVRYLLPSHFGFCLGVKNAVDRAYETLARNPGRRVFMLSELIHNPFVNEDLLRRGLRYLQSDRGVPYTVAGAAATGAAGESLWWDRLTPDDIVIIPAFGATNEDKVRLVRKGLAVYQNDATCMLVEKVWKAARAYGREGFTVVIHGKHEHEETKATFSNTQPYAPAVMVRDLAEARELAEIATSDDPAVRRRFFQAFAGRHTPGFDVDRDLQRLAVVNQTTLLMNETLEITELLREAYRKKFGDASRVGGEGRRDTLCYATQVNQDALARALAVQLDAAFVVGGRNSSNTYQLYRLCEQKVGRRAFFIQSERNILSPGSVEHYIYASSGGKTEVRPLWTDLTQSKTVLLTGGASCPDGILQQVITRINGFFPAEKLRSVDEVVKSVLDRG